MAYDRFPSRTAGPYSPPAGAAFGKTLNQVRDSTVREFGRMAESMRGYPAISVNTIPNIWIPGSLLSVASSGTAPAAAVRGEFPSALFVASATREGTVSQQVVVPGLYRLRLVFGQDAPGAGTVRWIVRVSLLSEQYADGEGPAMAAVGETSAVTVAGPVTNTAKWVPLRDLFIPERAVVGVTVRRQPATAPDTATADAFVSGLSLERMRSNA